MAPSFVSAPRRRLRTKQSVPVTADARPEESSACPSSAEIRIAITEVLKDKDLDKVTLKQLRRGVVSHAEVGGERFKQSLEGSRRDGFKELAVDVINDMKGNVRGTAAGKPDWLDLEDEEARSMIYLVTFAHILADTAASSAYIALLWFISPRCRCCYSPHYCC